MANKRIVELGRKTRFTSENQPENRGRKPKLYTIAKKAYGLSYEEYKEMRMYLMQLSKAELEKLSKDKDTPMWIVILCRSYIKGAAMGDTKTLEETKTDLWGKDIVASKIDITTNGRDISNTPPSVNIQVVTNDESLLNLQDKSISLAEGKEDEE